MGSILRFEYFRWRERILEAHAAYGRYQYDLIKSNVDGDLEKIEAAIDGLIASVDTLRKFHATTDEANHK